MNKFHLCREKNAFFIISSKPSVAQFNRCNGLVPSLSPLLCSSAPCFFQYLLGCNETLSTKLCVEMHRPIRSPSRQSRLPDETLGETEERTGRKEGRMQIQERERGEEDEEEVCVCVCRRGARRRKTMRQNQKINEVLFRWKDLCTVNITLAIRGNPITRRLSSSLLSLWEGGSERVRDENQMATQKERKQGHQALHDSSNFQQIFIHRWNEKGK